MTYRRRHSTAAHLTGVSARRTYQPFGHTAPKVPHWCPECHAPLAEGYACPACADRGSYHLAVPRPACRACGHRCPVDAICPRCGGDPMGPGDLLCVECDRAQIAQAERDRGQP